MRRIERVYLSGPGALMPDARALAAAADAACREAGVEGVRADDGAGEGTPGELRARILYAEAVRRLRSCQALIADLTPWRGPHPHPQAAWEAGFAAGLGLPVFAYLNVDDADEAELRARVAAHAGAAPDSAGGWRDPEGGLIEDMGLPESALLWAEARSFHVILTPDPLGDVTGLELCLQDLARWDWAPPPAD